MAFPIITPSFYKELIDPTWPEEMYEYYTDVILSPAAVEYVLNINNRTVLEKLMSLEDPISYKMAYVPEAQEEEMLSKSEKAIAAYPPAKYYWQLRQLVMGVLQDRAVTFEKRMLLLNYALKTIQGMIDKDQPDLIPRFASDFISGQMDYEEVLKFFRNISPNPAVSLSDGVSLLKSLTKISPAYKEVMNTIYRNLGVSGPEALNLVDMKKYIEMRTAFTTEFMEQHSSWIENIMVNYVWVYSIPYSATSKLSIWENYVFFNSLYNALKVLVSCYMPGKTDDDFAKAVSAFGDALYKTGSDIVWKIAYAVKNAGQANNGDMAILTIS